MNDSTLDKSLKKVKGPCPGRQRGGSGDDDEDCMHEEGVDFPSQQDHTHFSAALPTGKPKEAQHQKPTASAWNVQNWQTLQS